MNGGQPINFNQLLSGILGGVLGMPVAAGAPAAAAQPAASAPGQPAPQGVGARPAAAAAQPGGAQQAMRQVDSLVASMRSSVDQAAQRVHDARNAMQVGSSAWLGDSMGALHTSGTGTLVVLEQHVGKKFPSAS